jgi:hypothetical protein
MVVGHARMEHRLDHSSEPGIESVLPFVLRYAQLHLVLGDEMSLQALLTRAVAACKAPKKNKTPPPRICGI